MERVPQPVTKLDIVFGSVEQLPPWDSIPEEFKRWSTRGWVGLVAKWFASGLPQETVDTLTAKSGIDKGAALAVVSSILRSFEPKHEHKEAGCAYLMSLWFEPLEEEK